MRIPLVFDMETGDPDDFMTLALLIGHPQVDLRAVTVTPGTPHQIGVVRYLLNRLGVSDTPVGAFNMSHVKGRGTLDERYVTCVSDWHYKTFGEISPSWDAEVGWRVLYRALYKDVLLVTGGPLKNLGALLRTFDNENPFLSEFPFQWVAQGGFAGEGVVPAKLQLPKFKGMATCPTYNLNGDPESALLALASKTITEKTFVAKNVCHGVVYDQEFHERLRHTIHLLPDSRHRESLQIIFEGMGVYLGKHADGKKFHDPLAACCAIDPSIGTWAEVELYRERGGWGSRLAPGSGTRIIIDYDRERFFQTFVGEASQGEAKP